MFIALGTRLYGKVDRVPGLLHVATRFFYFQYIPLVPLESVIVREDLRKAEDKGVALRLNGKSVLFAWLRAGLVFGSICLAGAGLGRSVERGGILNAGGLLVLAGLLFAAFRFSYRLTRAGIPRALELASRVGVTPEELAAYFDDVPLSEVYTGEADERSSL